MNPIKAIEELILLKEELREAKKKIEYSERKIDYISSELIEFLKHKRLIETRTVG